MNLQDLSPQKMYKVIIGSGPAGMGAAYILSKKGHDCLVIDKESTPGGLCRTINFHGYLFDIGGHRFLTQYKEIKELWHKVMKNDMLTVARLSRIFYRKKYFNYPITFFNTFRNLGLMESFLCIFSFIRCKLFKPGDNSTFEGWVTNQFGRRLYNIFFKTYTEKVWAMACQDISATWAKERIRGLSLRVAIQNIFSKSGSKAESTLYRKFLYPRTGPGEFYNRFKNIIEEQGGEFAFERKVSRLNHHNKRIESIVLINTQSSTAEEIKTTCVFSSIPLPYLVQFLSPGPPQPVIEASRALKFRSFITVNIILDKKDVFPDQWLYIHSPEVRLGRIQNYKNWSSSMLPDQNKTTLGLEYFCTQGDSLWNMNDIDLIKFALEELEKLDIVSRKYLIDGFVTRAANAYPVYDHNYLKNSNILKDYISSFTNLETMGRAGLFQYDNSDKALLSGIQTARGYLHNETPKPSFRNIEAQTTP